MNKMLPLQVPKEELPKQMSHAVYQRIDDVLYQPVFGYKDYTITLPAIKQLKLRDSDVLVFGYPRSGNHWAFEIISMVLRQSTQFAKTRYTDTFCEMYENQQEYLDQFPAPRQIGSHLRLSKLPTEATTRKCKIIYLLRNPKDVLESWYTLTSRSSEDVSFHGSFEEFLPLALSGEVTYGSWFDHVLDAENFIKSNPDLDIYVHSYEKTKEKPVDSIKNLCQYLNKPDNLAEEIAKAVEIKNMKTQTKEKFEILHKMLFDGKDPEYVRNGIVGGWKKKYTVAQNEAVDRAFNEKLGGSKLGEMLKVYLK